MAKAPLAYLNEAAIIAIGESFANRTLPKPKWTHAAHFAACLWVLRCRSDLEAERDMPDMIRAYNDATGVVNSNSAGYHETITLASIRASRAFLAVREEDDALHVLHAELMAGPCGQKNWLFAYWSRDVLMDPTARKTWVAPNLKPLSY